MNTKSRRIVIIDDEPAILKLLHGACNTLGFRAESTSSADEFRQLALTKPDFVLMDLIMPDVDGIELLRFLAENHVASALVLVSGTDPRVVKSAARLAISQGLRVQGILSKPFDIGELRKILLGEPAEKNSGDEITPGAIKTEDMGAALANGEMLAFFQPQVDLLTGNVSGCEALVRWNHPEKGMVFPNQFIPAVEQSGLMPALTDSIFAQTLRYCAILRMSGFSVRCSVNVSAISLTDIHFPDRLLEILAAEDIPSGSVVIEITESRLIEDSVNTFDVLTRLRMKGFELSIDDFGTGYSTLRQLQLIPFNELKIDKEFVFNCNTNRESESIVRTSIELAQRLSLRTVAEGVESLEAASLLRKWGCDLGQGYLYARALHPRAFLDWLAKRQKAQRVETCAS